MIGLGSDNDYHDHDLQMVEVVSLKQPSAGHQQTVPCLVPGWPQFQLTKLNLLMQQPFSLQKYKIHLSVHSRALIVGGDRAMSKMQGSTIRPAIHINREVYF